MRRDFLIRSSHSPEDILAALKTRSREWRESAVPAGLRQHGVYGVQIQIKGSRFRMRSEAKTMDWCELRCQGEVYADRTGSVIRGRTRQSNPAVSMVLLMSLIQAVNLGLNPRWGEAGNAVLILALTWALGTFMMLLGRNQARHQAEALEFERLLETAAWPPGSSPSARVAV